MAKRAKPFSIASRDEHSGIDVSKGTLVIGFYPSGAVLKRSNDAEGRNEVVKILKESDTPLTVLEASGGYEFPVIDDLYDGGVKVALVNPFRTHHYMQGVGQSAKTDDLDAVGLARYGAEVDVRLYEPPSAELRVLKSLAMRRHDVTRILAKERTRLQRATSRRTSYIEETIAFLTGQKCQVDDEIQTLIDSSDEWSERAEILRSVPGVGPVNVAILVALLPELGKANRKQLAQLVGVAPSTYESGDRSQPGHIHGGRFVLRETLYMATLSAIKHNPVIAAYYAHYVNGEDKKAGKVALIACERKLITILNTMVRHKKRWVPPMDKTLDG